MSIVFLTIGAWTVPKAFAQIEGGSLDPNSIPKYEDQKLVIPPAMPKTASGRVDYYEIAVRQFEQQILPDGFPETTVWSYGSVNHPGTVLEGGTFNYPAFTIEATFMRPVRVKWMNELVNDPVACFHSPSPSPTDCEFLPHILPVDQTLHWANPPGGEEDRDMRPEDLAVTPGTYTGPVPMVPHLHGGHNAQESDGFAEAWYLPAASNIPAGFATEGTWYAPFKGIFQDKFGVVWEPGTATFQYQNDQRAGTFWYHDHTLGMTRVNVYAGPAGFYLLRRGPGDLPAPVLPGPAPTVGSDPFGKFYEIPIAIQDRSFNDDGSLFYPGTRAFFDEFGGPYIPFSDVSPIWNPEFFGNTMVVNGRTWPQLEVEPRRYRLRFLNGCNSRFLLLKLATDNTPEDGSIDDGDYAAVSLPFWQIAAEGGFLPAPVNLDQLLMGLAERADVIVDFGAIATSLGLETGDAIYLVNQGPDEPFGGGTPFFGCSEPSEPPPPPDCFEPSDPGTTGQVMKFTLVDLASRDTSLDPARLRLPAFRPLGPASNTRQVSLNEAASTVEGFDGPIAALLGTMNGDEPTPLAWDDDITENPAFNSIEVWEIYNFTEDAHPIHIHEIQFQVVDRQPFEVEDGEIQLGDSRGPEIWETGFKDTVIAYPGEVTRVRGLFDLLGLYVWHCHIVEHEDNEMMRPLCVGPLQDCEPPPQ
ncbi:MAG TPA: multicopper oxidase [Anaeromyxobacter sp.]|nr:multicopper oxidase [Anaeromyxobacter sp.]